MGKLSNSLTGPLVRIIMVAATIAFTPWVASAEWREEIGVFRIGIVTQGDTAGTLARSEPFRSAVADVLNMDVEFFAASSITPIMDALKDDRIEYAMLSASGYSLINAVCECVEPLAIPRASDSSDAYHLIAISRYGENLTLQNLIEKKVAILSSGAIVSENIVCYLLTKDQPSIATESINFQTQSTSQMTEDAFLDGQYDILFGWSSLNGDPSDGFGRGTLRRLVNNSKSESTRYEVLWKSPPIPHRPHVVRKKLPGEVKNLLRDLMVNLFERNPVAYDSIEPVYGGGFAAARKSQFETLDGFFVNEKEKGTKQTPSPELQNAE